MPRFTIPRDIYYGKNALDELSSCLNGYQKAFIVTGGNSMRRNGYIAKLEQLLANINIQTCVLDGVEPDPSIDTVMHGAEMMLDFEPDVIIAIGGGSPIDAAKGMWIFYEHPELTFEDIKQPFSLPHLRNKAIFAAIPSTSGTASEVTAFSVITDYSCGIKYPIADFEITPDIAVLDAEIPLSMPETLTAYTGMDALTHAIEAYTATAHSRFSDPPALAAISDIFDHLADSYHGSSQARGIMHIAQCLAGMAFSNALLGIAHSIAHKTGAVFHLPHGCCNAILLPYVMQYNAPACMDRYAQIAGYLGLSGKSKKTLTESLLQKIHALNCELNIPCCFRDAGVSESLLCSHISQIAANACSDPCTASNPRPIDQAKMEEVIRCAYYGTPVTI